MPRVRTAKTLAKRIDLQYFAKPHPFRRWKLLLSILVPVVAAGWILSDNVVHKQHAYTSGPMSVSHTVFGDQCALCHVRDTGFRARVVDNTCLSCHDAPAHNQIQTFIPACSSCHLEHLGKLRLAATADSGCIQCHSKLETKNGVLRYDPRISGFDGGHPQFASLRKGQSDPGTIKLNHYVHLQPTLRGPAGQVQMQCDDCHRPLNVNEPWPYSVAAVQPASQQPLMVGQAAAQQRKRRSVEAGPGAYMTPIRYVNQCAACHLLQFDPLIPTPAPHAQPQFVHDFVVQKLTEFVAANPGVLNQSPTVAFPYDTEPQRNIVRPLGETVLPRNIVRPTGTLAPPPLSAAEWVRQRTAEAERLLWNKNCKICHAVTQGGGEGLPTSVKAVIPVRWFPHAEFDHEAHRMMTCTACHTTIPESRLTSDINVPGVELCRNCHQQRGPTGLAAGAQCYECHSYHDWRNERRIKGKLDIALVRGKGPSATPLSTTPEIPQENADSNTK